MKITNKLIDDVVKDIAGEDVVQLVAKLKNKKNVSEFKLADMIRQEVNIVRNMLYRLYDASLVSFIRRKDKKKGWYIYYWTFNIKRIKHLATDLKKKKIESLKERLKREVSGQFYTCRERCIRLDFDQALGFEFKCPECGEIVDLEDNKGRIVEIEKEIASIETELKKDR